MEKAEHGVRVSTGMSERGLDRTDVALACGVKVRTVTNWRRGITMPSDTERAALRRLMPGYDEEGDRVEIALMHSTLTEDRRYDVLGYYKRRMREQAEAGQRAG